MVLRGSLPVKVREGQFSCIRYGITYFRNVTEPYVEPKNVHTSQCSGKDSFKDSETIPRWEYPTHAGRPSFTELPA